MYELEAFKGNVALITSPTGKVYRLPAAGITEAHRHADDMNTAAAARFRARAAELAGVDTAEARALRSIYYAWGRGRCIEFEDALTPPPRTRKMRNDGSVDERNSMTEKPPGQGLHTSRRVPR